MSAISYYTEEGLQKLKDELEYLKTKERPSISQQIAEARDKGDLSENAEYDAAKNAQGLLELKISKLEELVSAARIIDKSKLDSSRISILSKVKIRNCKTKQEMTYVIVSETEANLKEGKIAASSPIAKALIGKATGDVVEVTAPAGVINLEVVEVSLSY